MSSSGLSKAVDDGDDQLKIIKCKILMLCYVSLPLCFRKLINIKEVNTDTQL